MAGRVTHRCHPPSVHAPTHSSNSGPRHATRMRWSTRSAAGFFSRRAPGRTGRSVGRTGSFSRRSPAARRAPSPTFPRSTLDATLALSRASFRVHDDGCICQPGWRVGGNAGGGCKVRVIAAWIRIRSYDLFENFDATLYNVTKQAIGMWSTKISHNHNYK